MACFEKVHGAFKDTLTELIKQMFERFANIRVVIACVSPVTLPR